MQAPPELNTIDALDAFVQSAWDLHADQPQAVADELRRRGATLTPDASGAAAVTLGEHVLLAHLGRPESLQDWLATLPAALEAQTESGRALQRARTALAELRDEPDAAAPDALRWGALQNVWAVWVQRGEAARALAQLRAEEPRALSHADAAATRALAATCNNTAVELCEGPRGDARRDALMLAAAEASRRLWGQAGTWIHAERAEYRLARCHAVLGHGALALAHARACLAGIDAHADDPQADALERLFAHEALAWASRAAGDAAGEAAERERMAALLPQVEDAGLRDWASAALHALAPKP